MYSNPIILTPIHIGPSFPDWAYEFSPEERRNARYANRREKKRATTITTAKGLDYLMCIMLEFPRLFFYSSPFHTHSPYAAFQYESYRGEIPTLGATRGFAQIGETAYKEQAKHEAAFAV